MVGLKKIPHTIPPTTSKIIVGDLVAFCGIKAEARGLYLIVVGMASRAGTKRKQQLSAASRRKDATPVEEPSKT